MTRPAIFYNTGRPASNANFIGSATLTGDILQDLIVQETAEAPALPNLGSVSLVTGTNFNQVFIDATWTQDADDRIREYEVQVERDGDGVVMTFRTDTKSTRIEPVLAGSSYTITIFGILTTGIRNQITSDTIVAATDTTVPATPSGLSIGAGLRTITASWTDNTEPDVTFGVGRYRIQLATDSAFDPGDIVHDKHVSGTITSFTDLSPNTAYWVRIASVDTSDNTSAFGSSETVTTSQTVLGDMGVDSVAGDVVQDLTIVNAKIGLLAVDSAQIALLAVDEAQIANAAIHTLQVADAQITDAKIINLSVAKLTTGTLNAQTITLGQNIKASGTVTLNSGGSGSVTGITVNGIQVMSGTVNFNSTLTITAADVAANILAHTSSPNYTSTSAGTVITIIDAAGGSGPNGFEVISSTVTITTTDVDLSGGTDNKSVLKSDTYVANVSGFLINGDGDAELNNAIVRGDLIAGTITLGSNAWHVDALGNMWWGNFQTYSAASIKISAAGVFNMAAGSTFGGSIAGATGAFLGTVTAANIIAGTINGMTITGSTLQTGTSGDFLKINANDMEFYDNGVLAVKFSLSGTLFQIDGTAGGATTMIINSDAVEIRADIGDLTLRSQTAGGIRVVNASNQLRMTVNSAGITAFDDGTTSNQVRTEDRVTNNYFQSMYASSSVSYLWNTNGGNKFFHGTSTMGTVNGTTSSFTTNPFRWVSNGTVTNGFNLERGNVSTLAVKDNVLPLDLDLAITLVRGLDPITFDGTGGLTDGENKIHPHHDPEVDDWCPDHGPMFARTNGNKLAVPGQRWVLEHYTEAELSGFSKCWGGHTDSALDKERINQIGFGAEPTFALDPRLTEYFTDTISWTSITTIHTTVLQNLLDRVDLLEHPV